MILFVEFANSQCPEPLKTLYQNWNHCFVFATLSCITHDEPLNLHLFNIGQSLTTFVLLKRLRGISVFNYFVVK